jgi:hypothetical protein
MGWTSVDAGRGGTKKFPNWRTEGVVVAQLVRQTAVASNHTALSTTLDRAAVREVLIGAKG